MCKFRDFDKYEIYEDGRIWSYKKNRFLKPTTAKDGYQRVWLTDNEGKEKWYQLHRVVWESVTGEPIPENLEINHIDERKDNNSKSNLELVSHKQNCNWGSRNNRISKSNTNNKKLSEAMTNNPKLSKPVGAFKDGVLVLSLPSINEAKRQGFNIRNVYSCCIGERKTHKGFEWRYL